MNPANDRPNHTDIPRTSPQFGGIRFGLLLFTLLALLTTGAIWLWAEYGWQPAADATWQPWDIKHPAMVIHAAFALLFVFLAGTLLPLHMQLAWRQGRNRVTGLVIALAGLLLILSGHGLWYAGDDGLRQFSEWLHWLTGFGFPLLLAAHAVTGRRLRPGRNS